MLSTDGQTVPDVLAMNAASLALATSDIPWQGPVAAVRVARIDSSWVVNPTYTELQQCGLQLLYAHSSMGPRLIEADGRLLASRDLVAEAIALATAEVRVLLHPSPPRPRPRPP